MPWDSAPWMIGGGVKHSVEVARLLAYTAFGGLEGIIGSLDLEVRELDVPAGSVRIEPGACAILNRNPGVAYDAYAARLPTEDVVAIPPTGSGSARTDLIVARVKNPFLGGEPYPEPSAEDIEAGNVEFVDSYVLSAVPGVTPGTHPTAAQIRAALGTMSAIPPASIAIPASTGTILDGYIKDQRTVAAFRESVLMRVVNPTASVVINGTAYKDVVTTPVTIPPWATHFTAAVIAGGGVRTTGNFAGYGRVALGTTLVGEDVIIDDGATSAYDRVMAMAADNDIPIPAALRGTSQNLRFQMARSASATATITWDTWSSVRLDITFHIKPEKRA